VGAVEPAKVVPESGGDGLGAERWCAPALRRAILDPDLAGIAAMSGPMPRIAITRFML
jgi:hypothetical protein